MFNHPLIRKYIDTDKCWLRYRKCQMNYSNHLNPRSEGWTRVEWKWSISYIHVRGWLDWNLEHQCYFSQVNGWFRGLYSNRVRSREGCGAVVHNLWFGIIMFLIWRLYRICDKGKFRWSEPPVVGGGEVLIQCSISLQTVSWSTIFKCYGHCFKWICSLKPCHFPMFSQFYVYQIWRNTCNDK